jgi:hypothetical protein
MFRMAGLLLLGALTSCTDNTYNQPSPDTDTDTGTDTDTNASMYEVYGVSWADVEWSEPAGVGNIMGQNQAGAPLIGLGPEEDGRRPAVLGRQVGGKQDLCGLTTDVELVWDGQQWSGGLESATLLLETFGSDYVAAERLLLDGLCRMAGSGLRSGRFGMRSTPRRSTARSSTSAGIQMRSAPCSRGSGSLAGRVRCQSRSTVSMWRCPGRTPSGSKRSRWSRSPRSVSELR